MNFFLSRQRYHWFELFFGLTASMDLEKYIEQTKGVELKVVGVESETSP